MSLNLRKIFKKSTDAKSVIVVSGLPRSGTSMMMKMLEAGGLEILTDNLRTADASNPKGYYEYERVKALKAGDFDWLPQARGKVVKIISALLEFLPNQYPYKIVFMRRDMGEVLSSQRQMLIRDGKGKDEVDDDRMAALYGNHLQEVESWLEQQPNISVLYVSYNQTLADPEPSLRQINPFLGGNLDLKAMLQVVDPNLYRERRG